MTKTKSTKRALLSSLLVLLVCVSMLIGTTYAWFTDSVTSDRNIIQAGNLDAMLSFSTWDEATNTWGDYQEVNSDTIVFGKDAKYEPGYTEVVKFKVENLGSLAFQYQLGMHLFNENPSTNVYGEEFYLSDYIKVGVADYIPSITDRASAAEYATKNIYEANNLSVITTELPWGETMVTPCILFPAGTVMADSPQDVAEWVFVIHMPTTVGNEANHKSAVEAPSIEFAVNLIATQYNYESDSFGIDYDKDAEYAVNAGTIDGLANALAVGEDIVLTDDITVTTENKLGSSYGFLTYGSSIDGGGKTITDDSASRVSAFYAGGIDYIRNLTLKTNSVYGIFVSASERDMSISNVTIEKSSKGAVLYTEATKNLILDNVNATGTGIGATASAAHAVVFATGSKNSSNITINSGTYTATDANGYAVASFYGSVVTINGGTFTGKLTTDGIGKIVIKGGTFNVDPSAYVADGYVATESNGIWTVTK